MMKLPIVGLILFSAGMGSGYLLHEWGTFTSVSGSDGELLSGLQREEEKLPSFVESLDGMANQGPPDESGKGFAGLRPLRNVTIKMETPVIYFYSDRAFRASVEVQFNGGSINQWYPRRSGGEIVSQFQPVSLPSFGPLSDEQQRSFLAAGGLDFARTRQGGISWDLEILPPDAPRSLSFKPHETLNWVRPRHDKANLLKVEEQHENYLFYRGVGNFELPIRFHIDAQEVLHIENRGVDEIPFFLVHEMNDDGLSRFFVSDSGLPSSANRAITEPQLGPFSKSSQKSVYDAMSEGLRHCGLFPEEAHGMVQTWWDSYFEKPGLRIFWIVPEKRTAEILPLKVSPAPKKMVRVLVGRSEILRPRCERKLLELHLNRSDEKGRHLWAEVARSRYGLAYEERVMRLAKESQVPSMSR